MHMDPRTTFICADAIILVTSLSFSSSSAGNEVEAKANHIIALIDGYFISADIWHLKDDDICSEWGLNLINAGEDDITLSGCSVLV